jgi:tRNA/rRNA methyltransferase
MINKTALKKIRIILVEPAGPLNVGSVARVMKKYGLKSANFS